MLRKCCQQLNQYSHGYVATSYEEGVPLLIQSYYLIEEYHLSNLIIFIERAAGPLSLSGPNGQP